MRFQTGIRDPGRNILRKARNIIKDRDHAKQSKAADEGEAGGSAPEEEGIEQHFDNNIPLDPESYRANV